MVADSWGLAAEVKSVSSALPQSFERLHSIQPQSEDKQLPSPARLVTTFLEVAEFDWLDPEMVVVALRLRGTEGEENQHLAVVLLPDRALVEAS